jgi:hypothetical protein
MATWSDVLQIRGAVTIDMRRVYMPTCMCYGEANCMCFNEELEAFFQRNATTLRRLFLPSGLRLSMAFWRAQPASVRLAYLAGLRLLKRKQRKQHVFVCCREMEGEERKISVHRTFGRAYAAALHEGPGEPLKLPEHGPSSCEEIEKHSEERFDFGNVTVEEFRTGKVARWNMGDGILTFLVERRVVS